MFGSWGYESLPAQYLQSEVQKQHLRPSMAKTKTTPLSLDEKAPNCVTGQELDDFDHQEAAAGGKGS